MVMVMGSPKHHDFRLGFWSFVYLFEIVSLHGMLNWQKISIWIKIKSLNFLNQILGYH